MFHDDEEPRGQHKRALIEGTLKRVPDYWPDLPLAHIAVAMDRLEREPLFCPIAVVEFGR